VNSSKYAFGVRLFDSLDLKVQVLNNARATTKSHKLAIFDSVVKLQLVINWVEIGTPDSEAVDQRHLSCQSTQSMVALSGQLQCVHIQKVLSSEAPVLIFPIVVMNHGSDTVGDRPVGSLHLAIQIRCISSGVIDGDAQSLAELHEFGATC